MQPLNAWLADLQRYQSLSHTDTQVLLGRQASAAPPQLQLALHAAQQPGDVALDALLDATPQLGNAFDPDDWHETPAALLKRCAQQVAHGWRTAPGADGTVPAVPAETPPNVCETTVQLRDTWLATAAARAGKLLDRAQTWPLPVDPIDANGVQLPVLLLDPMQTGRGVVARLRLWRVPATHAALRLGQH